MESGASVRIGLFRGIVGMWLCQPFRPCLGGLIFCTGHIEGFPWSPLRWAISREFIAECPAGFHVCCLLPVESSFLGCWRAFVGCERV